MKVFSLDIFQCLNKIIKCFQNTRFLSFYLRYGLPMKCVTFLCQPLIQILYNHYILQPFIIAKIVTFLKLPNYVIRCFSFSEFYQYWK
jgi:hypothetical protein